MGTKNKKQQQQDMAKREAPSKKGCDQNCTQLSWTLLELVGGFIEKRVYFVDVVGV